MKIKKNITIMLSIASIACVGFLLANSMVGCGKSSGSDSTSTSDSDSDTDLAAEGLLFPRGLAVASPFDVEDATESAALSPFGMTKAINSAATSRYEEISEAVNTILDAESAALCTFNPALFTRTTVNADCYGPSVEYQNHPDGTPANGTLPGGDVGIWMEADSSGNACAAAQLNARMAGVRDRTRAALMGLASIVCAINTDDSGAYDFPHNSTTVVTDIMPEPAGVTWNLATMTHAVVDGEDKYSYVLDFDYNDNTIYIDMAHIPGADPTGSYRGRFSFRIGESVDYSGNCPSGSAVTRNGSLVYNRSSSTSLAIESKDGQFCGLNADGLDSEGIVDETMKYNDPAEPNGWANDFNLLRAQFNPQTRLGNYAYAWQAGMGDGNVRAFNLVADDDGDDATEDFHTVAFFGYGSDMENDDPAVKGFIGNWAGPNGIHNPLKENAQKQVVDFNSTTRKFDSTSANIRYAPTNSLDHVGGGFAYDSDGNGSLDESGPFTNDLAAGIDSDSDGTPTIEETIAAAGISVPSAPTCTNCAP